MRIIAGVLKFLSVKRVSIIFTNKSNYEKLLPAVFLAASAGGVDAYSYLLHNEVFAGLQTGNLILLGINLGQGNFDHVGRYLFSLAMFMLGVLILRFIQHFYKADDKLSRQSLVINYEIVLLLFVIFIADWAPDLLVLAILSMSAAAQLQEFRKLHGSPYTSLMMTGNLRTVTENLYNGVVLKEEGSFKKVGIFGSIIFSFFLGAAISGMLIDQFKKYTIFISIIFLVMAIIISHIPIQTTQKPKL